MKKIYLFILLSVLFCTSSFETKANPSTPKIAYLTFDDGPSDYTTNILNTLKKNEVKATFFVIGVNIERFPKSLLFDYLSNGHYIGLHSMTHNYRKLYRGKTAPVQFTQEMLEEQNLIYSITNFKTSLIRPPFSGGDKLTDKHINELLHYNFKVWDWNIDSRDWSCRSVYQVIRNIHKELEFTHYPEKIVVLLHEKKVTMHALPTIIAYLKKLGYTFEVYDPNHHFPINFRHYDYI